MCASRQSEFRHRSFQESLAWPIESTIPFQLPWLQLGICMNPLFTIAMRLPRSCRQHAVSNRSGVFGRAPVAMEFSDRDRRHLNVNVQTVLERTREFRSISTDLGRRADAVACRIAIVSARTGIHGRNQHEARWVAERAARSGQDDVPVFERLAKAIQDRTPKLGRLIQEQDPVVRQ